MAQEPLRFNKDGKFKIMLLGDIHDYYDMKSDNAEAKMDDTHGRGYRKQDQKEYH